jgi:hypothetical protein
MKTWPDPTTPGIAETDDAIRRTYAIFPDDAGRLGFYRLAGTPAVWERIRTFNEVTHAKPFLEFRYLRTGPGQLRLGNDGTQTHGGHFIFGYHDINGTNTVARFILSAYMDRNNPSPGPWVPGIPWRIELGGTRDYMHNPWSSDLAASSTSLYSDRSTDNVFGLSPRVDEGVVFLPHADGAPHHNYLVRSDYRTLEDLVCWRLKEPLGESNANSTCGVPNVGN